MHSNYIVVQGATEAIKATACCDDPTNPNSIHDGIYTSRFSNPEITTVEDAQREADRLLVTCLGMAC